MLKADRAFARYNASFFDRAETNPARQGEQPWRVEHHFTL